MLKKYLKKTIKKTLPRTIDFSGKYDRVINDQMHKLVVPMFHRIIDNVKEDPFELGMCVTKDTFDKQAKYFSKAYKTVKLSDYYDDESLKLDASNYISLTFDDGYKDNILNATPILDKYKLDATFFVCCSIFNENNQFWWDLIIQSFSGTSKNILDLSPLNYKFPETIIHLNSLNKKSKLLSLLEFLWTVNDVVLLKELACYIEKSLLDKEYIIDKLNESDIKELHSSGFEIAAHTMTHPNLRLLNAYEQKKEFIESKHILEEIIGDKVRGFAYPAGFQDASLEKMAKDSGYDYAVSTANGVNRIFNDYAIERVGIPETNVPDIKRCIHNYCKY